MKLKRTTWPNFRKKEASFRSKLRKFSYYSVFSFWTPSCVPPRPLLLCACVCVDVWEDSGHGHSTCWKAVNSSVTSFFRFITLNCFPLLPWANEPSTSDPFWSWQIHSSIHSILTFATGARFFFQDLCGIPKIFFSFWRCLRTWGKQRPFISEWNDPGKKMSYLRWAKISSTLMALSTTLRLLFLTREENR